MIYVKSTFAGLVCSCVASLLVGAILAVYMSVVYHLGIGPIGWNSGFFRSPLDLLFTAATFSGGFIWEFRRSRPA
jgi:hypothetical protein